MEKWFMNILKKVMQYNGFKENMITVNECDKENCWTPCDLILREYLNNNGGSAKEFLGITKAQCTKAYNYILANKKTLLHLNYLNRTGFNNLGFRLWNYI